MMASKKAVLTPYRLQCERPPLSAAYGPPDFHVLQPGCPEDSLEEKTLKEGYKETAVHLGISEDAESLLTHTPNPLPVPPQAKPLVPALTGEGLPGIRSGVLKALQGVFAAQLAKRKAAVQYDVSLSGALLSSSDPQVPPLMDSTQEAAHFWLQDLAGTRPLRYMAHGVPVLLARQQVLRVMLSYQIPVPRAVWCMKMLMANQFRKGNQPPSAADQTSPFTRIILEQLEQLLVDPYEGGSAASTTTPLPPLSPMFETVGSDPPPEPVDGPRTEQDLLAAAAAGINTGVGEDAASRLKYLTRLMVGLATEGLLDLDEVVTWSGKLLGNTSVSEPAVQVVHTLLQSCMESICLSPLNVRTLAERLTEVAAQQAQQAQRGESPDLLRSTCLTLVHLVVANPSSLLPLDCLPQLCEILLQQASSLGSQTAPVVTEYVNWLKSQSTALALSVTPPRTLGLSDCVAMQRLYKGLASADVKAGAAVLQEYIVGGGRGGSCPIQEGVSLVCEWAVGDTLRCVDPTMLVQPAAGQPRPQSLPERLSADPVACLLFALQLLRELILNPPAKLQKPAAAVMQEAVFTWLDARLGCGVDTIDKSAVDSDTRNVVSLLLLLVEVKLFSPELYLTQLLSMGILTQTGGKAPCNNESELQRAQRHRRYLQCLHPELLQRPGPYSMAPTTPELAEEPVPVSTSTKSKWSKNVHEYARDRRSALSAVQPSDTALQHTSKGPSAGASTLVKDESGVYQPPAKRQRVAESSSSRPAPNKAHQLELIYAAVLAALGHPVPNVPARVESGELPANVLDFSSATDQFGDACNQVGLMRQIKGLKAWQQHRLGTALKALVEQRMKSLGCKDFSLTSWLDDVTKDIPLTTTTLHHPSSTMTTPPNANLTSCLPSGDMWLLRAVALLVACGFSAAAVELLVQLLDMYLQDRVCAALDEKACTRKEPQAPVQEAQPVWAALKVHAGTVIAALDSLQDRVAAMGILPRLLDTATSWAFKYNISPLKGRQYFGRLIHYAGSVLGTYSDSAVCKDWWGRFQKAGQPQAANSQHWLVGDLEALLSLAASSNAAARASASATNTGSMVMPLVSLLPKSGTQRWLQKLSSSLKAQVETAANNHRTFPQIINRTASCDNAEGIMDVTDHWAKSLAGWSAPDGQVNEDLVVAAIAALVKTYVKAAPAMVDSNSANPFHPTPACIRMEAHIRCVGEFKRLLVSRNCTEAEVLVPHALLASVALVLRDMGFNAKTSTAEQQVIGSAISLLLSAVAHGLVSMVDVLTYLLAPGQVPEPVQLLCRAALLGGTCCRPHGGTGASGLAHIDLGASCVVESLQQRLAVDTVWTACEDLFRRAVFGVVKDGEIQVLRSIVGHTPTRRALLSDPRVVYQRLSSGTVASLPLDRLQQSLTLPARLMAVCIIMGDVMQLRHCRPLLESEFDIQQMALLSSVGPHTVDLHWLLLRLLMDEQVLSQAIRVERKVPKLALETAQAAFAETNKDRDKDRSECSQVDKNFCEVMLISILQRTQSAVLWAELAWQLGKAVGDYLLMRFYVILQDRTRDLLSGTKSVTQKLMDMAEARKKQTDLMRTSSAEQESGPQVKQEWSGPVDMGLLQFSATTAEPFAVEQALADLVLVGLTKSNTQLRTKIAMELVRQLGLVADLLKALPTTSIEQLLLLLSQQNEANRLEDGGELTPSDGLLSAAGPTSASDSAVGLMSQGSVETATVRRRIFGPNNARLQRRASGTKGGDTQSLLPHVGLIQVGVWLKLRILLPLLPMVYADKESDPKKNMRAMLASTLMQLTLSPYVHSPLHLLRPVLPAAQYAPYEAAARAAELAGEPLLDRLLSVLHAVVAGHWAAWLRGNRSKLREVPVHDGCAALAAEVQAQANLPLQLRTKILSCLPLKLRLHEIQAPSAAPQRMSAEDRNALIGKLAGKASRSVDPWLPLEVNSNTHGTAFGGCIPTSAVSPFPPSQASPLLLGAIRRKRNPLTYASSK